MRHRHIAITLIGLAAMVFGSVSASPNTPRTSRGRIMPLAKHGRSFAALQPVGAATGWGRVVVRDDDLPSGQHRTVQVWLWGMESRTEYLVEVDGVKIGTIQTRSSGSGVLKLQNLGHGHDPVPDDLPLAELLKSTTVYGPDLDPTLEGTFTAVGQHKGETTYEEEITLVNVPGGEEAGMAEVEMKESGHQEFKTRATGLIPGSVYSVIVDGLTVASVTADEQGQARVHLEDPDDDNPLPPELFPVSEIATVEWWDAEGLLLLSGTFTGAGVCEHITGTVSEVGDGYFTIETDAGPVTVVTTDDTEWDDFGDHELIVGDMVKVEGCWVDDDFVADEVELKGGDDDESCEKFVGIVTEIGDGYFTIETDTGPVTVVTTNDTEWDDFGDHELIVGDMVKVEGCWVDDDFVADEVELKGGDDDESCEKFVGIVTEIGDGYFTIETDTGPVTVVTTDDTEWDDFGDHELIVGDMVKVEGCWVDDDFVADEVELKGGDDDESCEKFVGIVTEIGDGYFTIETDTGPVTVVTTNDTEWDDFGDHELIVGDMVKVEGCWVDDDFVADEIELKKVAKLRRAA